ncbi:hypothetical protein [Streptomyces sp. NPDC014805]|uniref:hypothetical protein n=1 Tax=Streptomyces sp. NPDC014805 TaxID=3364919 RepID=UPI0036F9BDD8
MVWSDGRWRYASIMARQGWAEGRVFYQVHVDLLGDARSATACTSGCSRACAPYAARSTDPPRTPAACRAPLDTQSDDDAAQGQADAR